MSIERAAIVGTAESWVKTPWSDPGLVITTLNDAYTLGFKRLDEHYETHPLDKFYYRKRNQREVIASHVPPGHFVRPEGHVEWLKEQARTIPIWLKETPPAGWPPNARRFPLERLEQKYGAYWASGPAYMLMHLLDRGVKELHVYGIHLATSQEYRDQRPNWEFLLGRFLGREMNVVHRDGKRYYEGTDALLVLPDECKILTHGWKYGFEPSPQPDPRHVELQQHQQLHAMLTRKLAMMGRWANRGPALDRLRRVSARIQDLDQSIGKVRMGSTLRVPVIAA